MRANSITPARPIADSALWFLAHVDTRTLNGSTNDVESRISPAPIELLECPVRSASHSGRTCPVQRVASHQRNQPRHLGSGCHPRGGRPDDSGCGASGDIGSLLVRHGQQSAIPETSGQPASGCRASRPAHSQLQFNRRSRGYRPQCYPAARCQRFTPGAFSGQMPATCGAPLPASWSYHLLANAYRPMCSRSCSTCAACSAPRVPRVLRVIRHLIRDASLPVEVRDPKGAVNAADPDSARLS